VTDGENVNEYSQESLMSQFHPLPPSALMPSSLGSTLSLLDALVPHPFLSFPWLPSPSDFLNLASLTAPELRDQTVSLFNQLSFGPLKKLLVLIAVRLDQFVRRIRHSRK
jgi:hypothetical protein